jgi:MATE family multidrug resistance protein
VTSAQVFAIAGPAMVANLTTPLIGIVSTIAIGRLGDATLLGGVAIASVIFDCLFWLFAFLRMSTVAFTAQALGAGETLELRALLVRGFMVAALVGGALIVLQIPLAAVLLGAMGGSEGVTRAAKVYFSIRIWSAPLALANYVVLGWLIGQAPGWRSACKSRSTSSIWPQPCCWCWCCTPGSRVPRSPLSSPKRRG